MANHFADVLRISELEDQLRDANRRTESLQLELTYLRTHTDRQIADLEADLRQTRNARDSQRKSLARTRDQLDKALKGLGEMREAKGREEAMVDAPRGVFRAVWEEVGDEAGSGVREEDDLAASQVRRQDELPDRGGRDSPSFSRDAQPSEASTSTLQQRHEAQDTSSIKTVEKMAFHDKMVFVFYEFWFPIY